MNLSSGFTIGELVTEAYGNSVDHGFHDEPRTFGDAIALIHSEASEALEAFRDVGKERVTEHALGENGKPEGIPSELADIVIRVADMCGEYGIDLEQAIIDKTRFNRSRPFKHGGRTL